MDHSYKFVAEDIVVGQAAVRGYQAFVLFVARISKDQGADG